MRCRYRVLFLGALTPAAGLVCLLGGPRRPSLAAARARSRPLLALLTGSLVVLAALATTAALPWLVTPPGPDRTMPRPRAPAAGAAGPLTLPLWTAQLTVIALAGVMLAQRGGSAARIERRVTRAAAVAIVAAVSTAGFLLLDHAAALITDTRPPSRALAVSIAAAVPVALAFLPLYTATLAALDRAPVRNPAHPVQRARRVSPPRPALIRSTPPTWTDSSRMSPPVWAPPAAA